MGKESVARVVIAISQCGVYAFPDSENLRTILVVQLKYRDTGISTCEILPLF